MIRTTRTIDREREWLRYMLQASYELVWTECLLEMQHHGTSKQNLYFSTILRRLMYMSKLAVFIFSCDTIYWKKAARGSKGLFCSYIVPGYGPPYPGSPRTGACQNWLTAVKEHRTTNACCGSVHILDFISAQDPQPRVWYQHNGQGFPPQLS